MMTKKPCPFCEIEKDRVVYENEFGFYIRDGFPVSPGHSLVIPKRHVGSFFEISEEEKSALLMLLDFAKADVEKEFSPDAYNVGINDGPAAGQTVPHLHIHLIPRYEGDSDDPRGGVRWVVPGLADYWSGK